MNDFFIMKKRVDKSTLYQGVSIPVMFQELFYEKIGHRLSRGETMTIKASKAPKFKEGKALKDPRKMGRVCSINERT